MFRVGNWEVRDDVRRKKVLQELREFIGFEMPKAPLPVIKPRVLVPAPARKPPAPPAAQSPRAPSRPGSTPAPVVRHPPTRQQAQETFKPRDKVVHATFGEGVVISSKPVENDTEITIDFAGKGIKRLLQSFANLTRPTTKTIDPDEDLPF